MEASGPGPPHRRPGPTRRSQLCRVARWRARDDPGSARRALAVIEALATQVRAGADPETAWRLALELVGGIAPVDPEQDQLRTPEVPSSAARTSDGSPARSLGGMASIAGADGPAWRSLAAAWRLSEQTGAPLADVLDRLAAGLRQELEVEAEVEASLAAPRATARLLAGLPVVGVALGELVGAHPIAVLLGTPVGRACAAGGLLLAAAGQLWTRLLVEGVARAARSAAQPEEGA